MLVEATKLTTSDKFESYCLANVRSKHRHTPLIRDPDFPLPRSGMQLRTVSDYEGFVDFEKSLSRAIRAIRDDLVDD